MRRGTVEAALRIVLIGLAGYGAIVLLAYLLQRSLLYFPGPDLVPPAAVGVADMAAVTLETDDGLSLTAWYKPAAADKPVIALFHGNAGSIAHRAFKARPLIDSGYGVLLVEYRGYGGNPGKPTEAGLYADGRAALAFLAAQGVPNSGIVLYGESLGGGVAVELAAGGRRFAALVLEAPFTSVPDIAAAHYFYLPVRWLAKDRFASIDKIDRVRSPILIFQGERDEVIPVRFGKRLFAAAPEPKQGVFLSNGRHNDLFQNGAMRVVLDYLEKLGSDPN